MKIINKTLLSLLGAVSIFLTAGAENPVVIKLWDGVDMPCDNQVTEPEHMDGRGCIYNVSEPTLTIYTPVNFGVRPEANAGVAVLSCPGGGYHMESPNAATDMADWYNAQGITLAVLKYRMPNYGHYEATLEDVDRAMRILRRFGEENNIKKVGIMGASAGGHLASTQATHYRDSVTRPDFQILFYPVITLDSTYTHQGTRSKWLGKAPDPKVEKEYSNNLKVDTNTPPAILLGCYDDKVVPIRNSVDYFMAMRNANVPCTMFIWPEGDHGWGHIHPIKYRDQWQSELSNWLKNEVINKH